MIAPIIIDTSKLLDTESMVRIERDFPKMTAQEWDAYQKKYDAYLADLDARWSINWEG